MPEHKSLTGSNLHVTKVHASVHESGGSDPITSLGAIDLVARTVIQGDKLVVCADFTASGIQDCIDLLPAGGGVVYLPVGTYVCTDTAITINVNNTTLIGGGKATILDYSAGQNTTTGNIDTNAKAFVTIHSLSMLGKAAGGASENFIGDGDSAHNLTVQNCWFNNADGDNCIGNNGDYVRILNNHFVNSDGGDVQLTGGNSFIVGNTTNDSRRGFRLTSCASSIVSNNIGNAVGDYLILISGASTNCVVSGNICNGGAGSTGAIQVGTGSTYCVVSNNSVYDSDGGIADIDIAADYCTVIGNTCRGDGSSDVGIWLDEADFCVVTGNTSSGHDVAGIQEDADCQGNLIKNNNLQDTVKSIINGTLHEGLDLPVSLIDETGTYTLRDGKAGWGHLYVSDDVSYAYFTFTSAGVVTLVDQNNCTTTQNNDGTLNIYDSGTAVVIENELGATYNVLMDIHYIG